MTVVELTRHVQYIVDDQGNRKAAVLDISTWQDVLDTLEDLEDAEDMRQHHADDEVIPWEQAKTELRTAGFNV